MLLAMAGLAVVTAIVMQAGLKGGTPTGQSKKVSLRKALAVGLSQGRANPRLVVCYAGSFVARADLTLVAVFVSLWLQQVGRNEGLELGRRPEAGGRHVRAHHRRLAALGARRRYLH